MGLDFDRCNVGVALRDGKEVVGVSAPETLAVDVSFRTGLSVGLTVVVVDADDGGTTSAPAPTLFKARYDRYEGPDVLACRVGGGRDSSSSVVLRGERLVHRSISRVVVSLGRFSRRARPYRARLFSACDKH